MSAQPIVIYWYVDVHGEKQGSTNAYKIQKLAEQNHAIVTGHCYIDEFVGYLHNNNYD